MQARQFLSLKDRLALYAKEVRSKAARLPPGIEREALLEKARQADEAATARVASAMDRVQGAPLFRSHSERLTTCGLARRRAMAIPIRRPPHRLGLLRNWRRRRPVARRSQLGGLARTSQRREAAEFFKLFHGSSARDLERCPD